MKDNLITIAIRSLEQARLLAQRLEHAGITSMLKEVDLSHQGISTDGMRVRIDEKDLYRALEVIENKDDNQSVSQTQSTARHQILVPVDFSDYSIRACTVAFNIAHNLGNCEIVLLHAYILPDSIVTLGKHRMVSNADKENIRHFMATLDGDMQNLERKIRTQIAENELKDVHFTTMTIEGVPEEAIMEYCENNKPSLIVMGTRGKDKKEEDLIGSVTAEVIEHALAPVLAIPEDSELQLFDGQRNILFATNFDDRMLISFRRMMAMLKNLEFNLLIAHFEYKHDDWNEIKLAGLKEYCQQNYPNVVTNYVIVPGEEQSLDSFDKLIAEHQIDLIVLNTHKRSLLARLFNPSMARKMVFHASTPILVFHS